MADTGAEQVRLAAGGWFDQLEELLETEQSKGSLKTRDLHALCYAYSNTKHYDRLLPCLDRLQANVRTGDRRTRLFGLEDATPAIHLMRAEALIELAQYADAAAEARRGLNWLRAEKDDEDVDFAIHLQAALSIAATLGGDRDAGALHAAELAAIPLGIRSKDFATDKAMALARAYMSLGDAARALLALESDSAFKLKAFLDDLVSGAMLRGTSNWVWIELPRAFMIAKALFETGRVASARKGFDDLLAIPQVRTNGEIYWQLLHDRARIAEADGDIELAIWLYQQALDVIELQRLSIATEAAKIGFIGDKQAVYGRLVAALTRSGRPASAFDVIERSKARALVDLLAARQGTAVKIAASPEAASLLADYQSASRAALIQRPVNMGARSVGASPGAGASTTQQLARALRRADPEVASLVSVSTTPTADIRQHLWPNEVLLEYYEFARKLYLALVADGDVRILQVADDGLGERVKALRAAIESRDPNAERLARSLYDALIRPVEAAIAGKALLIVPHDVLHYVPFGALHDGSQYLVEAHALRYLPSASLVKFLKASGVRGVGRALVFGNPDLGDRRFDLPNAEAEAVAIGKIAGDARVLLRKEASKDSFRRLAPQYPLIHVASHGEFNAEKALESRLLLAGPDLNEGSLTVAELYGIRLAADLVTLSACETGLGEVLTGDDVLGLTRGFLYAGAGSVVASHWEVDDRATSDLMQGFYRHLAAGESKREALRQAQIGTRRHFAHPFYWAAFFLTGLGD